MIKLFVDEDVPEAIAVALRLRGYDVLTAKESGRKGFTDIDQLTYVNNEKVRNKVICLSDYCSA